VEKEGELGIVLVAWANRQLMELGYVCVFLTALESQADRLTKTVRRDGIQAHSVHRSRESNATNGTLLFILTA
jgi:hypothetical protein